MCYVHYMTYANEYGVATKDGTPFLFAEELDAWDYIAAVMNSTVHPKMMWVVKEPVCKSSTI